MATNASGRPPSSSPFSSSSAASRLSSTQSLAAPAFRQGIRRRREGSSDVEIEELDSCTMRQNSYNYFEHHKRDYVVPSLLRTSTFHSSLGRSAAASKRQRTLAEQLDSMCLQDQVSNSNSNRNRLPIRSALWDVAIKEKQLYSETAGKTTFVELHERGQQGASSVDESGSESDSTMDTLEHVKVAAEVGKLRCFFGAHCSDRRRPIDRMYRHYVTTTPQVAATTSPQGNELVVFRPPTISTGGDEMAAYLALTPQEFNKLSTAEKRQWYQAHYRYMADLDATIAEQEKEHDMDLLVEVEQIERKGRHGVRGHEMDSRSSSCSQEVLDVPSDVEMMEVVEQEAAPKLPHAAGALTHTEWFTDADL